MAEERIQKIMSEQGLCSRRAAEQIIAEGRVKVNGHPVKVGDKMDPNRDVLHVDDERIYIQKNQQMYYLALYKPRGYVTTASDEPGRTVMEMTLKEGKNREIRRMCEAVGLEVIRLKRNAEGVVKLGMLQPGKYRELTKAEVNGLRAAAAKGRAQTRSAALQSKAAARRPRGPVGGNKAAAGKKHK